MAKTDFEHYSIIIETIGFFFITIDLYGEERLEKLRSKVKQTSPWNYIWGFFAFGFLRQGAISIYANEKHTYQFSILYKFTHSDVFMRQLLSSRYQMINNILIFIYNYIGFVFVALIALFIISILLEILVIISNWFSYKGIMIAIGTVLFLLAKVLAYMAV